MEGGGAGPLGGHGGWCAWREGERERGREGGHNERNIPAVYNAVVYTGQMLSIIHEPKWTWFRLKKLPSNHSLLIGTPMQRELCSNLRWLAAWQQRQGLGPGHSAIETRDNSDSTLFSLSLSPSLSLPLSLSLSLSLSSHIILYITSSLLRSMERTVGKKKSWRKASHNRATRPMIQNSCKRGREGEITERDY